MKINQLENLILSQLGANQQTKPVAQTASYTTPVYSQQPKLEVKDPRAHQQSVVANPNHSPAKPVQQADSCNVPVPLQNNNAAVNQPTSVAPQQPSAVIDNQSEASTYALKIDSILKTLVAGRDFCQLPGVKNSVLLRSGLVKILRALNYKYSFKLVDKQLIDGILTYSIEATVVDSDGCFIVSGISSSNSSEKKFSDKGLSSDNILSAIASTRALRSCVKDILVR